MATDHGEEMRLVEAIRIRLRTSIHVLALGFIIGAMIIDLCSGGSLVSGLDVAVVGIVDFYLLLRWAVPLPIVAIEDPVRGCPLAQLASVRAECSAHPRDPIIATLPTLVVPAPVTIATGLAAVLIPEMAGFDQALLESIVTERTHLLAPPLGGVILSLFYSDLRLRRDNVGGWSS